MTMKGPGIPARNTREEDAHAAAAADEARGTLLQDGPAPTSNQILREMGRDEKGRPLPGRETLPASEAGRVAREMLPASDPFHLRRISSEEVGGDE